MVHINLHTLWVNRVADPSVRQVFPYMSALTVTTNHSGEVRRYASGRLRAVQLAGRTRTVSATLPACTREQVLWLERYQGESVCLRDDRGRKLWGVYFALPVVEHQYNEEADVTLEFSEVSVVEGVFDAAPVSTSP